MPTKSISVFIYNILTRKSLSFKLTVFATNVLNRAQMTNVVRFNRNVQINAFSMRSETDGHTHAQETVNASDFDSSSYASS